MLVWFLLVSAFFVLSNQVLAQTRFSPRQLKLDAVTALQRISTPDTRIKRTIEKAAKDIGRSLSDFLDEIRVSDKKVFERERQAVKRLQKAVKRKRIR